MNPNNLTRGYHAPHSVTPAGLPLRASSYVTGRSTSRTQYGSDLKSGFPVWWFGRNFNSSNPGPGRALYSNDLLRLTACVLGYPTVAVVSSAHQPSPGCVYPNLNHTIQARFLLFLICPSEPTSLFVNDLVLAGSHADSAAPPKLLNTMNYAVQLTCSHDTQIGPSRDQIVPIDPIATAPEGGLHPVLVRKGDVPRPQGAV